MNKKFLSAILFGALMVTSTGTFVSCKDYDDEIDDLQEQINKLATKEDMTSQIASLQSALTAAQSEAAAAKASAEDAVKKATDASSAATEAEKAAAQAALDAANAKAEAIKAAQDEVAKVKAELEASIDSKFEAAKSEFAETIAELTKKVEELTGYTTGMVTGISFAVKDNSIDEAKDGEFVYNSEELDPDLDVNYARVKAINMPKDLKQYTDASVLNDTYTAQEAASPVSSYEFGKGMPGAFTIKAGDVNTVPDYMLVNVDPVNAAVSSEMLSLINGSGENLNDYVNITCATWGGEIIRQRSAANTGLRKVGVQLKNNVDFEAFDKMVLPTGEHHASSPGNCTHKYIGYALAATDSKSRTVTSSFDVTLHVQEEKEAIDIEKETTIYSEAGEYSKAIEGFQKGGDAASTDEGSYPIESGEPFTINVDSKEGRVMASYVTLDKDFVGLSVTDKTALSTLKIEGTDAVITSSTHTITISGTPGIPVPLKLVTIDYLGNIKVNMIWVKASEAVSATVAYAITPKVNVTSPNAWPVATGELKEFTIPTNAATFSVRLIAGEEAHDLNPAEFITTTNGTVNKDELKVGNNNFLKLYKNTNKVGAANLGEVAYAEFVGTLNLWAMREDKAYSGTIKFYDATGSHLKITAITLTKVLPTTIPAGLTAKTGVIHADGSMPIYPKPQDGVGVFDLKEAFNISDGTNGTLNLVNDDKLEFNTESFTLADGTEIAKYSGRQIIEIASDRIGEDTKYPTTVTYDYGDIKYHPEGHGVEEPGNCIVEWATKFDIVLGCYVKDSKFAWHTEPSVVYAKETVIAGYDATTKKYVNFMTAKNPYLNAIDPFEDVPDTDWTTWAPALCIGNYTAGNGYVDGKFTVELWSNGDKDRVNEFFIASIVEVDANGEETTTAPKATALKLTKNPSATAVPENDVPTTVVFKFKDNFGHEEAIKALTFTMKKNAE